MSMTIFYPIGDCLYVNITNRCTCRCTFCIRSTADSVHQSDVLWLEHEPSVEEVLLAAKEYDFDKYSEIVFCGFGEPTERLEDLLKITALWKAEHPGLVVRINTNGLCDLSFQEDTSLRMAGIIDKVSVSMNASNKEDYLALTRSKFGIGSYDAMLQFAVNCKKRGIDVQYSIVDVLPAAKIRECQQISARMGVPLKIRRYAEG